MMQSQKSNSKLKYNFEAIGTAWQIDILQEISPDTETQLFKKIQERIELFDGAYSRFRDDSLVMEISRSSGKFLMPEDFKLMISLYREMYILTDGLVTPLIGQLISDAGYDKQYSLIQKSTLQPAPNWDKVMIYEYPYLTTTQPVLLDFGAAGKGYLIDIIGKILEENNIYAYTIDAGGDILHKSNSPIRIGMEHPENFDQVIGVVNLNNASLCGSAGNRRAWGDFNHIINPKEMKSPTHVRAVWVIAKNTLLADALTTCLFFISAHILKRTYDFQYVILKADFSIEKSASFPGELFQAR
jgi:thiamine biosynthesis lipoprotein